MAATFIIRQIIKQHLIQRIGPNLVYIMCYEIPNRGLEIKMSAWNVIKLITFLFCYLDVLSDKEHACEGYTYPALIGGTFSYVQALFLISSIKNYIMFNML